MDKDMNSGSGLTGTQQADIGAEAYRSYLSGDDGGMVTLICEYRDSLIFFLSRCAADPSDAEDLAQETFIRLATRRPIFRGESSFKTWLFAVGRNIALDRARTAKSRARAATVSTDDVPERAGDESTPEEEYIRSERDRMLRDALDSLKPEYRQALWLTYFGGLNTGETARVMKKNKHAIETLLYRARRALGEKLTREGFVYEEL